LAALISDSTHQRRVVVTGYGLLTCLGGNVSEAFEAARQGKSGVRTLTNFNATGLPCDIAGEVDDDLIPAEPVFANRLDKFATRAAALMCIASRQAVDQARLADVGARDRIGCMIGSHGADPTVDHLLQVHRTAHEDGSPNVAAMLRDGGYDFLQFYRRKPDITTALIASQFECLGPQLTIVSACAAGAQAIGESYRSIRRGDADLALCGGCEAALTYSGFIGFVLLKALCERYKSPETASRPFDRRRNGFIMSEGAAALVLEELEHAKGRGAAILGEVRGYGDSADAYRITDVHPKAAGAILAMRAALADAGVAPEDVQYINAHGTSTKLNDAAETYGIRQVFGTAAERVPVSSNKSMLGHAIAAAGAIEAILTLVGIRQSVILPTINYENPDPKCSLPDYVPNAARQVEHDLAISNSFGFGGQNACLCLSGYRGN